MGFLERAIKRGIGNAVEKAVGNAVQKKVEPKATELANKAANSIDQAARNTERQAERSSGLEGAVANLERSMQDYATKAATNMKICPKCEKPTTADKKFCPDCGAKLPAAIQEEQAQADRDAEAMAEWEKYLAHYPKWSCGGTQFNIELYDGCVAFTACFNGDDNAAHRAVDEYRQILMQNGFRQAGEHPCIEQLYKMVDGVCYHVDTGMCFEAEPDCPSIGFDVSEPSGGFNYVKPEPKKKTSFLDLFK